MEEKLKTLKEIGVNNQALIDLGFGYLAGEEANRLWSIWQKEVRKEALKWISKLRRQQHEMSTQLDKSFDRSMLQAKIEILKEFFNIRKVDRCNLCGRELREEDGEFVDDYELCNELHTRCINLCKKCRASLKEPPEVNYHQLKQVATSK